MQRNKIKGLVSDLHIICLVYSPLKVLGKSDRIQITIFEPSAARELWTTCCPQWFQEILRHQHIPRCLFYYPFISCPFLPIAFMLAEFNLVPICFQRHLLQNGWGGGTQRAGNTRFATCGHFQVMVEETQYSVLKAVVSL